MSSLFIGGRRLQLRAVSFVVVVFVLILVFTASSSSLTTRIENWRSSGGYQMPATHDEGPDPPSSKDSSKTSPPPAVQSSTKPSEHIESPTANKPSTGSADKAKDPCVDNSLANGGVQPQKVQGTRVLVTGGAGFIGSNLVDTLLKLGYHVRVFDNLYTGFIRNVALDDDRVEFVLGDILDPKALEKAVEGVEYVYHLAAMSKVVPSVKNPEMARFCVEANALGTWNVLNAVREQGKIKKVIYAASSTYYGNMPAPHQEDMAPDFLTPYAASKYEGELQMQMFDRLFSVNTISTRFFMVFGPRQPSTGAYAIVTGVFAKQAADGKQLTIEGDGSHYRDFIHVSDIVNGLILSQQHPDLHGNVVNLGTGTAFSVQEVADLVSKDQKHVPERKNDLAGTLADTCRMKKLLNYKAQKDFTAEMSYMVKETLAGNVFPQKWLKNSHALSAPHLLPPSSPLFGWPKTQDNLKDLLDAVQKIDTGKTSTTTTSKRFSVIPFALGANETAAAAAEDVLLNTIFSLVRFGEVTNYIVAAADAEALASCVALNVPCYDASKSTGPKLVSELLNLGYDVHFAQSGNSYLSPVEKFVDSIKADIYHAEPYGDVFIKTSADNKAAAETWAKEAHKTSVTDLFTPSAWLKTFKADTFSVDPVCSSSKTSTSTSSSSKSQESPDEKAQALDDAAHPTKAYKSELSPDPTATSTAWKDKREEARAASHCGPKVFYATVGCDKKFEGVTAENAADVEASLKSAGLWHLRECIDKVHCDKQQTVPDRWVAAKPDLAEHGGMC